MDVEQQSVTYPAYAECEGPNGWRFESDSVATVSRLARRHAAKTGHLTRVERSSSTTYRPTGLPGSGRG